MIGQRSKNMLMGASLLLNVLCVVGLLWLKSSADRSFSELSTISIDTHLMLQKHVLSELESTTPDLERLKTFLREAIDGTKQLRADIDKVYH